MFIHLGFLIPYGISLSGRNCSLIVCRRLVNVLFFNEISSEFYIQKWPKSKLSLIHPRCVFFVENGIRQKMKYTEMTQKLAQKKMNDIHLY